MSAPRHPFTAGAGVERTVLSNGLTVLARQDTSAPVVAIVTYVRAGYFDETDDVVGIAHVLEHMYFKGTSRRGVGEIARETKAQGGYLNAHTIYDHTSYYTVLPASSFERGLEIQADAYADSLIDQHELTNELEVIIQEAKRKADSPSAVASETLYETLYDRHRIRRWRIGREAGLRALTRDDVVEFYRRFYRPSNTVLTIVGDVDPAQALHHAARLYGALPDATVSRSLGDSESGRATFRFRDWTGDIARSQVRVGWRTPPLLDRDSPRLDMCAAVLGSGRSSRLYRAVRERRLASSVSAHNYTPRDIGIFELHAEAPSEHAAEAVAAMWSQVHAIRETGVGVGELERARRLVESRWIRRLEMMEGQASYLAEWEAQGDWRLGADYLDQMLGSTPDDIATAARTHLPLDDCAVVHYRPASAQPIAGDAGTLREQLGTAPAAPATRGPRRADTPRTNGATAAFDRVEAGVHVFRTPRDVPVLVLRRTGAPIVHLSVLVKGGAIEEGIDEGGVTTLMARTALKGTALRTAEEIAEDAEMLGGSISASAGSEAFAWMLSVPVAHTEAAMELLADVALHPAFPDAALDTERAVALSDLATLRDDMYNYPLRLMTEAAFAGHPYGASALGTDASLRTIDAARLREWHATHVLTRDAVIGIVGDIDPPAAARLAAGMFAELRGGRAPMLAPPSWPSRVVAIAERRDKAQSALALAFASPRRDDPARFAAHMVAGIASGLGGRFFDELRDRRSLAYTVHAFAGARALAGMFMAYIATSPEMESVAREALLAEFQRLRDEPVSEEELERAKRFAIGTHAIRQQSGGAMLSDLLDAWSFGGGLHELDTYVDSIRGVTVDSVQDLARRYFDPDRRAEGIVRGSGKQV
jgi:zinc protease